MGKLQPTFDKLLRETRTDFHLSYDSCFYLLSLFICKYAS